MIDNSYGIFQECNRPANDTITRAITKYTHTKKKEKIMLKKKESTITTMMGSESTRTIIACD